MKSWMRNSWRRQFEAVRNIAKWLIIPMLVALYLVEEYMDTKYYVGPLPMDTPSPPRAPWWLLNLRNFVLLGTLFVSLLVLPKWQSWLGLAGLALFLRLYGQI